MCLDANILFPHSRERPSSHCHTPLHTPHECTICVFGTLEIPVVPKAVSNLFSANNPPNDDILPSFLASLSAVRSISTNIQNCIDAMQSVLTRMQTAKATCALSIEQHVAVVHPIRYIPDDILLNIFEWHTWSPKTGLTRAPWMLCHVSQRWRALALSSASLWSTIDIPCRAHLTKEDHQRLASKWDVILQRSMQSDLFVRLVYIVAHADEFVHLLPPPTRRWKRLELSTRTDFPALISHCDFDRLTNLVLFGNPLYTETVSMFTRAPNLACLTLDGYVEIDVLWDRITSYSCTFHGLRYIHRFSALERLALDFLTTPGLGNASSIFPPEASVPLSLPTLRSLSIYYPTSLSPSIRDISKLLHLPSLTSLTIFSGTDQLPIFSGPLPHLRELCLRSATRPNEIIEFLTLYGSSVTSLHIRTVEVLHIVADRPTLFPNLTILSVDSNLVKRHPERVSEVLGQRCNLKEDACVARLVELRISGMHQEPREAVAVMERWHSNIKVVEARCPDCSIFRM